MSSGTGIFISEKGRKKLLATIGCQEIKVLDFISKHQGEIKNTLGSENWELISGMIYSNYFRKFKFMTRLDISAKDVVDCICNSLYDLIHESEQTICQRATSANRSEEKSIEAACEKFGQFAESVEERIAKFTDINKLMAFVKKANPAIVPRDLYHDTYRSFLNREGELIELNIVWRILDGLLYYYLPSPIEARTERELSKLIEQVILQNIQKWTQSK